MNNEDIPYKQGDLLQVDLMNPITLLIIHDKNFKAVFIKVTTFAEKDTIVI